MLSIKNIGYFDKFSRASKFLQGIENYKKVINNTSLITQHYPKNYS
jgi:hypothetical protein